MDHISYTNLRSEGFRCFHSGDITNGGRPGGKGAAEFIDISLKNILDNGGRYVLFQIYSYMGQAFKDIPCTFGWMQRSDMDSGEIFEPSTVEQNMAISANSVGGTPIVIDCRDRVIVWMDLNVTARNHFGGYNVESNLIGATAAAYSIMNIERPNLYDLVMANAQVRGKTAETREEADIIFSPDTTKPVITEKYTDKDGNELEREVQKDVKIVTPYDIDYYMGQLL